MPIRLIKLTSTGGRDVAEEVRQRGSTLVPKPARSTRAYPDESLARFLAQVRLGGALGSREQIIRSRAIELRLT